MAKPKIPKKDVTLQSPEATARLELVSRLEEILGHAKYRLTLLAAFGFLLLGLLVAGAQNVHHLNTQGIAYILLAKHYASGAWNLAVSSYWSPLLSWLITVGMKIGWSDPTAARVATGVAGFLFWLGSVALFFVAQMPIRSFLISTWLVALATLTWSIEYISPDLLAAALLVWAFAISSYAFRVRTIKASIAAGLLWGATYYASALLLPVVAVSVLAFGLLGHLSQSESKVSWLKLSAIQAIVALAIMIPWWMVLTSTYGQFTVTSVWQIDRAVVGPDDVDRYHPCFTQFNPPTEGRLSNWEDPARLTYVPWSASATEANQAHQEKLLNLNLKAVLSIFQGLGGLGLAILSILACACFRLPFTRARFGESWRWTFVPVIASIAALLPLAITPLDTRFFYAVYPFAILTAFCFIQWLPQQFDWKGFPGGFASGLLAVLFVFPILPKVAVSLEGIPNPGGYATLDLVERLEEAQLSGPVAGDGLLMGSRTGLYVATLLNQPWLGDKEDVLGLDYLNSGAKLIIVHRQHRVNSDMEFNPAFRDLDTVLFPDKMQAEEYPLRVYQVNQ